MGRWLAGGTVACGLRNGPVETLDLVSCLARSRHIAVSGTSPRPDHVSIVMRDLGRIAPGQRESRTMSSHSLTRLMTEGQY